MDSRTEGLEHIVIKIYATCLFRHHTGVFSRPISKINLRKKFELLGLKPILQMLKVGLLLIRALYAAFFQFFFAMRYLQFDSAKSILNIQWHAFPRILQQPNKRDMHIRHRP